MSVFGSQQARSWHLPTMLVMAGVVACVTVLATVYIRSDPLRNPKLCKPDSLIAIFEGGHLWWWQAIRLERHLDVDPADLCARGLLRGYYQRRTYFPGLWPATHAAAEQRLLGHYLWLVSNVPHARIATDIPIELWQQHGREIEAAWRAQADHFPNDVAILLVAGRLMSLSDPMLSLHYLQHAESLEPKNENIAYSLGGLFEHHADALAIDKDTATERALAYYRAATASPRSTHLTSVAESALSLGDVAMAETLGHRILGAVGDSGGFGSKDDAIHHGNLILGRVALRRNDIDSAKRYLLAAAAVTGSPGLDSFGPNMRLAKELLEVGERQVVLDYFEHVSRFWKGGCDGSLDEWAAVIRRGEIPQFGANLSY